MIDKATGALVFDSGVRIEPSLTLDALRAGPFASHVKGEPGQPWCGCQLDHCVAHGLSFGVQLTYEGQRLFSAQIWHETAPTTSGWDDPDLLEKVLAIKAKNDAFVTAWLGPPPWDYPWGVVSSSFDRLGFSALLYVRYRNN